MEQKKKCPNCGTELEINVKFCGKCGTKMPEEADKTVETMQPQESMQPQMSMQQLQMSMQQPQMSMQQPMGNIQQGAMAESEKTKKKKEKKIKEKKVKEKKEKKVREKKTKEPKIPKTQEAGGEKTSQKSGAGMTILATFSVILLVVATIGSAIFLGWIKKSKIELSEQDLIMAIDEKVVIDITNYEELNEPNITAETSGKNVVSVNVKDGTIVLTGEAKGQGTITVQAFGCEDIVITVEVIDAQIMDLSQKEVIAITDQDFVVRVLNYEDIEEPELVAESNDEDVVTVETKNDQIILTGEEAGTATVTVNARGCSPVKICVEVVDYELLPYVEIGDISNIYESAWSTEEGLEYYFVNNNLMYMIYEHAENYIRASYSVTPTNKAGADEYIGDNGVVTSTMLSEVPDGHYFIVEAEVDQELFYGTEHTMLEPYYLVVCTDGTNCAIYDSGWEQTNLGTSTGMMTMGDLESYFTRGYSGAGGGDSSLAGNNNGGLAGVNFEMTSAVNESWRLSARDSWIFFKVNGAVYGLYSEQLGTGAEPTLLVQPEPGTQVTMMAFYDSYFYYGLGSDESIYSETEAFYRIDCENGVVTMMTDSITIKDFIVYDGIIYYTDYANLYRMDSDGNQELLWNNGVFTFDVSDDYIYIFTGYAWEVIDRVTGDYYGYILDGVDGEYEADVARMEDGYLFYTAYNYSDSKIYLYALDMDGNVTQIGDAMIGETYDTYNLIFDGKYAYYTVGGGETLVMTNVTTGAQTTRPLSDSGFYYGLEMFMLNGQVAMYVYDSSGNPHYVFLDSELYATEITEMNMD